MKCSICGAKMEKIFLDTVYSRKRSGIRYLEATLNKNAIIACTKCTYCEIVKEGGKINFLR